MANFRFPAPVARASGAFLLAIASSLAGAPTHAQTTDLPQTPDKITLASFPAPQIEAQLANELLALARPLKGKEDELSLRSAHVLAVGLAHLGRTEEALRIAPSADEFYSHDAGAQDEIWAATARRKLAFGKSAEAKLAAARIKEPKMRGGVLAAFAFEALARNNKSEALAFLSQSVGTNGAAAGGDLRLAVLFARAGEIATARRIFGRAEAALKRSEDVMADEFADFNGLDWENIVAAQIEAGLSGDVAALVARIGKHRSDALDQLLSAGEFEAASALIMARKEPAERALLQTDLAWGMAASGASTQARELLIASEKEWAGAVKNSEDLRELLLFSALAWYTAGDRAQFERQMARLGEPGQQGMEAWEWTPLGGLAPRARVKAENLEQWDARYAEFTRRALELSDKPARAISAMTMNAEAATPTLRSLSEMVQEIGNAELEGALLNSLEKWLAFLTPKTDDENNATVRQETRLFVASAWQKRGNSERASQWLQQFLSAPDKDYGDRAAQLIEAGFVTQGRAYALKYYQPPLELNAYTIAPAEAAALANGDAGKQSFIEWSRNFPEQRVELLTIFANTLGKPATEKLIGEQYLLGKYDFETG